MHNHQSIINLSLPNLKIVGNINNSTFNRACPINDSDPESITWLKGIPNNYVEIINNTKANVIVCDVSIELDKEQLQTKTFILTDNPKNTFIKILNLLFRSSHQGHLHKTATVDSESVIGKNVFIGPNVVIQKSKIGDNTVIHGNCFIFENTIIGNNVIINPGTVIGGDGFGYSKNEDNSYEKFPHFGGVIIEDNVEIGSNTSIDKGTLGNTILRKGVKVDNLVHIAHNVIIGENSLVIANSMIGGSTKIGKNCWISPSCNILNGLEVGDNVMVGMNSTVTKSIPSGQSWAGSPAKPLDEFKELQNKLKKL